MPDPSVREQIADVLMARVAQITRINDFHTNAGKTLVLGERIQLGQDDPDSVLQVIVGDDDQVTWQAGKVFYRVPFTFTALSKAGRRESWRDAERLLQDVKRAIELADTRLDGLLEHPGLERGAVKVLERESGATDIGIEITYLAPLQESWGNP